MKKISNSESQLILQDKYLHFFDVYFEFKNELIKVANIFQSYGRGDGHLQAFYRKDGNFNSVNIEVVGFKFKTKSVAILSPSAYYGSFWTPKECLEVFESSPRIWTEQDIKNKYHSDDKKWIENNRNFKGGKS